MVKPPSPKPPKLSTLKRHGGERGVAVARAKGKSNSSAASASEIDVDKPLTDQQRLFVEHWAKGDSITSAMLRAGYSEKGSSLGYRLVRQPNILALKAVYEAKFEAAGQMTREKVMAGLLEATEMAKLMADPTAMIQGWKTIGQICGYFAPVEHRMKVDVSGNIVVDKLNSMSDAELLKLITSGGSPLLGHDPNSL